MSHIQTPDMRHTETSPRAFSSSVDYTATMPSPPPLAMASSSSSPFPYYGEPDEEKRVTTDSGSFKNELKEEDEEDSPFEM
ncbi:hypothetical protein GGI05_004860, partial [Coemansia sp. RSA 2603]